VKPVNDRNRPGVVVGATCRFCVAFGREVAQEPGPTPALSAGASLARGGSSSAPAVASYSTTVASSADRSGGRHWSSENKWEFKTFRTDQFVNHHRASHPVKWKEYRKRRIGVDEFFFPWKQDNPQAIWKERNRYGRRCSRAIVTDTFVPIAKFDGQRRAMQASDRAKDFFESRAEDDFDDSEAELEATDDGSVPHPLRRRFV
jgi:hypothetical protein